MKRIDWTGQFKRDYRREAKTLGERVLETLSSDVLMPLSAGSHLQPKHKDHALTGDWKGCRGCHLKPDLVMVYETDDDVLILHRLGSHAEIYGK